MTFIFLVILLFILYIEFINSGKDILSPAVLFVLGYIITTCFAIYNMARWKSDISLYALVLLTVGIIAFTVMGFFVKKIRFTREKRIDNITELRYKLDQINNNQKLKTLLAIMICTVCTIIVYHEVRRIAFSDYKSWGNLIYNYKVNKSSFEMSGVGKISRKISKALAYVYAFLFANSITSESKIKFKSILHNLIFITPGIIFCIQQLLLGVRIGIISFFLAVFFDVCICNWYKYGKKWKLNISKLIKVILFICILCISFFYVRGLVGRLQQSKGVIDYIATYLGGSLDLFSQYINDPDYPQNSIETFSGIVDNAQAYFGLLQGVSITKTLEFRKANTGVTIGNTYTGFRNYYNDFGIIGIILLSMLLAGIFCAIYKYLMKRNKITINKLALLVFYSSQLYCILFHFFADYFFSNISINMLLDFLFMYLFTALTLKTKRRVRFR